MIEYIIIVATLAAFFITLAGKWGYLEYVQVHGNEFFAKMFSCKFCLSFWVCVIISSVIFVVTGKCELVCVPFCAAPITRFIL